MKWDGPIEGWIKIMVDDGNPWVTAVPFRSYRDVLEAIDLASQGLKESLVGASLYKEKE